MFKQILKLLSDLQVTVTAELERPMCVSFFKRFNVQNKQFSTFCVRGLIHAIDLGVGVRCYFSSRPI